MSWSATVAKVISTVMNPFSLAVVVLLLVTYVGSGDLRLFFGWVLILLFFLVGLPLTYVYIKTPRAGRRMKQIQNPLKVFREHRKEISVVGIVCALPCILLLIFLGAPSLLIATLVALLGTTLAVGLVNLLYRASYHLAFVTNITIAAALIWGQAVFPVLLAIPLVGWARYSLRQHSPAELAAGVGLALVISTASSYYFGLLGSIVM